MGLVAGVALMKGYEIFSWFELVSAQLESEKLALPVVQKEVALKEMNKTTLEFGKRVESLGTEKKWRLQRNVEAGKLSSLCTKKLPSAIQTDLCRLIFNDLDSHIDFARGNQQLFHLSIPISGIANILSGELKFHGMRSI